MDALWKAIKNPVLAVVGTVSVIVGVGGMILPLVAGIPFLILAGVCFRMLVS
ncbi:MAG: hypothetical protein PUP92_11255 [Rhizonema sp. PD38]|nr:hypothetical protein [Rhizonema sp. PD38]